MLDSPRESPNELQSKIRPHGLALQLRFLFEMGFLRGGLMSASPERPRDYVGWVDASSREALGYPADFLD
jgi:hypothetical protein